MLVLRATSGLEATALIEAPLSVTLLPLHCCSGKVATRAIKDGTNGAYDTFGVPTTPILGAPEGIGQLTKHFFYMTTRIATCIKKLMTHRFTFRFFAAAFFLAQSAQHGFLVGFFIVCLLLGFCRQHCVFVASDLS